MNLLILDYGSGNIKSVYNSIDFVLKNICRKYKIKVSNCFDDLNNSDYIVLPGVGSFQKCRNNLYNIDGLMDCILENVLVKCKPFLGICVGMQLLADFGLENGKHKGFGWIKGQVKLLQNKNNNLLKIPHMGWNNLEKMSNDKIFNDINKEDQFYFVHSYYFDVINAENILALTNYGKEIPTVIKKNNIYGFQFHPEKSGFSGQKILKNWLLEI